LESAEINASAERRFRLFSPKAVFKRRQGDWRAFITVTELVTNLARRHSQLKSTQADLASLSYLTRGTDKPDHGVKAEMVGDMVGRGRRLEQTLNRGIEILRAKAVNQLLDQHPHTGLKLLIRDYSELLYDESLILTKQRNTYRGQAQKFLADDAMRAWKLWQYVAGRVYEQTATLEREGKETLNDTLLSIDKQIATYQRHHDKARAATARLEELLGTELRAFIEHYRAQADLKKARHRKWQADIEWVAFQMQSRERESKTAKFQLEQQMLDDNLKDLEQGDLWQWPQSN
jgi:hypothetical protein